MRARTLFAGIKGRRGPFIWGPALTGAIDARRGQREDGAVQQIISATSGTIVRIAMLFEPRQQRYFEAGKGVEPWGNKEICKI